METRGFWELAHVTDAQLRASLIELLAHGYRTEARIIAHLAEVEERRLHTKDAAESLFAYCTERLGLSNSEAFHRITAARIARQFPLVFELLERRELHLSAVCMLRDFLTTENHRELLMGASHKTKLQLQELLARRFPREDVSSGIRKLPSPRQLPPASLTGPMMSEENRSMLVAPSSIPETGRRPIEPLRGAESQSLPIAAPVPRTTTIVEPLSEARYRIQLNASLALKEKLDLARALLSHSNPSGDISSVIERALDLLLEKTQKERFGVTDRPRKSTLPSRRKVRFARAKCTDVTRQRRERIPSSVRREIVARDGLRCTFVGDSGERCTARSFLQIHHVQPWARGGSDVAHNLRMLCAAHNQLLAEEDFGAEHVALKISQARQHAQK